MRKTLPLLAVLLLTLSAGYAQDYRKNAFGAGFSVLDFTNADDVGGAISSGDIYKWQGSKKGGLNLDYWRGITNHVDLAGRLTFAFVDYPFKNKTPLGENKLFTQLDATLNAKLLKEKSVVNPFLTAGIAGFTYASDFGALAPLGVGIQFNIGGRTYIMLQAQDRIAITSNANDHLQYSLTFLQSLRTEKVAEPKVVTPPIVQAPKDSDGDGIPDDKDECPTQAGPTALNGCPDKDGDGIADKNDKCPDVAGLVKYQGCPVPDTDKDGINDENDKCPTVPGLERYQGCPIPDTDGDGLNDEEDKCPQVAGRAADYGCPAVLFEAKKIQFATGKATLLKVSYVPLNKVVAFMKENPEVKIDVLGHTDNTGTDAVNEKLSQKRADAVAQYFAKQGISADRVSSKGFGSTQPIADNKTSAGRAQNRRTEFLFHR